MTSTPLVDSTLRRLNGALAAYIVLCVLHQFAHGVIDELWARSGQITFLVMFGMVPMAGTVLLWTANYRRVGGIVVLGSVPAAALFMLMNRFVDNHVCVPPLEFSAVWRDVYDATYYLMIVCALVVTIFGIQFLRAFHASASAPLSE